MPASADTTVGNEVVGPSNASLVRAGAGTGADPFKLSLNSAYSNNWTASQSFSGGAAFPGTGIWDTQGRVGIGTASPGQMLSVAGIIESTTGGYKFPDGTIQILRVGLSLIHI